MQAGVGGQAGRQAPDASPPRTDVPCARLRGASAVFPHLHELYVSRYIHSHRVCTAEIC
jgi:hypothetical protein